MPKLGLGLSLPQAKKVGFPNVAGTNRLYVAGTGSFPFNKTTTIPAGFTFSGSENIYYLAEDLQSQEIKLYRWVMFSGSPQSATGGDDSVPLLANTWYMLSGVFDVINDIYTLSLTSTNTTPTQTSATIPLSNWSPVKTITSTAT